MLNMNSPTVQNIMQSGFNPYANSGYVPQQQQTQNNYYGYNPYRQQQQQVQQQYTEDIYTWTNTYDPMPTQVINQSRGINSQIYQQPNHQYPNNMYNPNMFNGYSNPFMMKNQMENEKIRQREEAISQGKIWRTLLQNSMSEDDEFDIDEAVGNIESLYYYEPKVEQVSVKDRITIDKNNHLGELEGRLEYYRQNNIPIPDKNHQLRMNFYGYYNKINEVINDVDNCDMVDYFTRVYPELRYQQLSYEAERFNRNLKNRYNSKDFNKLLDKTTEGRSDSFYAQMMKSFNGIETANGAIITADEMEIKLPDKFLKNKQDVYYEQRKKFYNSIFNKNQGV